MDETRAECQSKRIFYHKWNLKFTAIEYKFEPHYWFAQNLKV